MNAQASEERKTIGRGTAALRAAFVVLGLTAVTVQVLLLRELMVAWRGNEMSFGVTLSVWLALAGAGSALYGVFRRRIAASTRTLAWGLLDLESRLEPVKVSDEKLAEYVGGYGPRRIFMEDGALYYQRDDRPRYKMEPMGEDLFRIGDLDYFRLTFERDGTGKIIKVIGQYDSGRTDENPRDPS